MEQFNGFQSPNYTATPDELFDVLMPDLTGAELKVLLYIVRRTFGFKKSADDISIDQLCNGIATKEGRVLDRGTGLSNRAVIDACKSLVAKGIITASKNENESGGFEATTFAPRITPPPSEKSSQGVVKKVHIQETVDKNTTTSVVAPSKAKHPAIQAFRGATHRYPAKSWYDQIIEVVGDEPAHVSAWSNIALDWVGRGWNPTNVKGMLEKYAEVMGEDGGVEVDNSWILAALHVTE